MSQVSNDKDMLDEYDFSNGIRGKYAKQIEKGTNVRDLFVKPLKK